LLFIAFKNPRMRLKFFLLIYAWAISNKPGLHRCVQQGCSANKKVWKCTQKTSDFETSSNSFSSKAWKRETLFSHLFTPLHPWCLGNLSIKFSTINRITSFSFWILSPWSNYCLCRFILIGNNQVYVLSQRCNFITFMTVGHRSTSTVCCPLFFYVFLLSNILTNVHVHFFFNFVSGNDLKMWS